MFLGIDPERAVALSGSLRAISSRTEEIGRDLLAAELLADLPTGVHPLLADLDATTASLGTKLSSAATQVSRFRISLQTTHGTVGRLRPLGAGRGHPLHGIGLDAIPVPGVDDDADRARHLVGEIQTAIATGGEPSSLDVTELDLLFGQIDSDKTRGRVVGLVLDGFPVSLAMGFRTSDDIDWVFDRVAETIHANQSPAASDLPAELFPADYVRWHEIQDEIDVAAGLTYVHWKDLTKVNELHAEIAHLNELRAELDLGQVAGPNGTWLGLDVDGGATYVAAGALAAAHLGGHSAASFGNYLAAAPVEDLEAEVNEISALVAADPNIAVGYFAELGAFGSTRLLFDIGVSGRSAFELARANFSMGLALASHDPALGFSGADFIAADDPPIWHHPLGTSESMLHAEMLLLDPSFNVEWLVDAASQTFSRGWVDPSAVGWSDQWIDPRLTVMLALINNDAAGSFVGHMDSVGRLHEVLNGRYTDSPAADAAGIGPAHFGRLDPNLVPVVPGNVPHVFFAQVGSSLDASRSVIAHLGSQPGRVDIDLRLANGVSTMLAAVSVNHLEPGAWQEKFFAAYRVVLQSGSGHDVALVGGAGVLGQFIAEQLSDGVASEVDVGQVGQFVAQVEAHRFAVFNNNAALADLTAQNQLNLLEQFGFGAGVVGAGALLVAGPYVVAVGGIATGVGLLASLLAKSIDDSDEQLEFLRDELLNNSGRRDVLARQVLTAAFESGRVVDIHGLAVDAREFDALIAPGVVVDGDDRLSGLSIDGIALEDFVTAQLGVDDIIDNFVEVEMEAAGAP